MDFKEEIVQFMADKVGGITIVAEGSAEIVYADSYFRKKYGTHPPDLPSAVLTASLWIPVLQYKLPRSGYRFSPDATNQYN